MARLSMNCPKDGRLLSESFTPASRVPALCCRECDRCYVINDDGQFEQSFDAVEGAPGLIDKILKQVDTSHQGPADALRDTRESLLALRRALAPSAPDAVAELTELRRRLSERA